MAVELAVLLPFLLFCFIIGIDVGRVYYVVVCVTYCARDGALYASQNWYITETKNNPPTTITPATLESNIQSAALADRSFIPIAVANVTVSPDPSNSGSSLPALPTDADGNPYVSVTVNFTFNSIVSWVVPGQFNIPSTYNISRTCTMRVAPLVPS